MISPLLLTKVMKAAIMVAMPRMGSLMRTHIRATTLVAACSVHGRECIGGEEVGRQAAQRSTTRGLGVGTHGADVAGG
jgi:hypothetical protein